jgi:hypothetical protein
MSGNTNPVTQYACKMPNPAVPYVDISTGQQSREWFHWSLQVMARTGGLAGIGTGDVQDTANTALANANAAQTTANTGVANAATAQTTANTALADVATETARATAAEATLTSEITTETASRIAADALKAPLASPHFTGTALFAGGIGVWGHAAPGAQPAAPVLLADVIAVLQAYGLTA